MGRFKNNFADYLYFFRFFYSILGNRLFINALLNVIVSFLDGIGLAIFLPILNEIMQLSGTTAHENSPGKIHYLTDSIKKLGFQLTITNFLIFLILLFIVKGFFKLIQSKYQIKLEYLFIKKIRYSFLDQLQNLTYKGFLKMDAGKIQNTMIAEVDRVNQAMYFFLLAARSVVMVGTYIALAVWNNYMFAILVVICIAVPNFIYRGIYKATKKTSVKISELAHSSNSFLIQTINFFKYLKATNYFENYTQRVKSTFNEAALLYKKIRAHQTFTSIAKEPIIVIIIAAAIYLQLVWIKASLAPVLLSLLLFYRALRFLIGTQNYWQYFVKETGALKSVITLSQEMALLQEAQNGAVFETMKHGIKIKEAIFSYNKTRVLKGVSINIQKNQTVGIVGESGAGKTTLVNMISGLIQPDEGAILIDDVSITEYNLKTFRSKIGYVSQDAVIFNDNIFNNVTFWADPTPENKKRFWKILELASISSFVHSQPEEELTPLGDNGILISGGQKQRISIARELYKNIEILIFDEATSALDSETEKDIQENIKNLRGIYTIIIITHRLSTIKDVDKIYLLQEGKVLADGSFNEILRDSVKFKHMVSLQDLNEIISD